MRGRTYDIPTAISMTRIAILLGHEDKGASKYLPKAYQILGACYEKSARYYEAAIAYESVFTLFPDHALASKACYEAGRCFSLQFEVSKDKRDEDQKEKYLSILAQKWPNEKVARNIRYMQAEKIEKAGDLKKAGELYLQVGEDAEAYENPLVAAGHCLHADAECGDNARQYVSLVPRIFP